MPDMDKWGKVNIVLDDYIKQHNVSRSKLTRMTGLQYSQILKYCRNDIQKMDLNILAKLCTVLDCKIIDILKFEKDSDN